MPIKLQASVTVVDEEAVVVLLEAEAVHQVEEEVEEVLLEAVEELPVVQEVVQEAEEVVLKVGQSYLPAFRSTLF